MNEAQFDLAMDALRGLADEVRMLRETLERVWAGTAPMTATHPPPPLPLAPSDWPPGPQPTCIPPTIGDLHPPMKFYQKPTLKQSASVHDSTITDER